MKFIKNIKIGWKLTLSFGVILCAFFVIVYIAAYNMMVVFNNYSNMYYYPMERYIQLRIAETRVGDMRRIVNYVALNMGNLEALTAAESELNGLRENIGSILDENRHSLDNDWQVEWNMPAAFKAGFVRQVDDLENQIDRYFTQIIVPITEAAKDNNQAVVFYLLGQADGFNEEVSYHFSEILYSTRVHMDGIHSRITNVTPTAFTGVVVAGISTTAVGLLFAILVSITVARPIKAVAAALQDVEVGKLNVNIRAGGKDEVGVLAQSTLGLVDTLQSLVLDMDKMADAHDKGEIDIFIDSSKFSGVYSDVAEKINYMVAEHIKTQHRVISVVSAIANGDFDIKVEQFPGKKVVLNDAIENMRGHIKEVSSEVEGMIQAASGGQLSAKIDVDNYEGGWRAIMEGLNQVTQAVYMPISEIRDVMSKLSNGEFDTKVAGDYKGEFLTIRETVNETIDELASYITEVSSVLSAISGGDLSLKIDRYYVGDFKEIKFSINNISEKFHQIVSRIEAVVTETSVAMNQISDRAAKLSGGVHEQAEAVHELNATMDMISQQTHQNADNASTANQLSTVSTDKAETGNESMKQMLEAMEQIKNQRSITSEQNMQV